MPRLHRLPALLVAVVLACADPSATLTPDGSSSKLPDALIGIGEEVLLAYPYDDPSGNGLRWTTSDSTIVALVAGTSPSAVGLREGNAVLTGTVGAVSLSMAVAVRTSATMLVIEDFHVVEDDGPPSGSGLWGYAPKLRLRPSTTRPPSAIAGWELMIPGVSGRWGCLSNVTLSSAAPFELFGEAYGDYAYQLPSVGKRATFGAPASIRVRVEPREGKVVHVRAWGPVVPAARAPSFAGPILANLCTTPLAGFSRSAS
jgi:hypothetical protein